MARSFNGTSDYIRTNSRQWPQSALTTSCIFNLTSLPGSSCLPLACYDFASNAYYQSYIVANGQLTARVHQVRDTIKIGRMTNIGAISGSTLYNLVVTWSGGTTNAAIKIYLNGTQADALDDGSGSFTAAYSGSDLQFTIGTQNAGPTNFFGGMIAEVAIWNVELNAGEVGALGKLYSPMAVRTSGLIFYTPMVRENVDRLGGFPTLNGTGIQPHPPIINKYRQPQRLLHTVSPFTTQRQQAVNILMTGP